MARHDSDPMIGKGVIMNDNPVKLAVPLYFVAHLFFDVFSRELLGVLGGVVLGMLVMLALCLLSESVRGDSIGVGVLIGGLAGLLFGSITHRIVAKKGWP
ncbi:MAG: hypothetical protein O3C23_00590 [bacterium]|nr:hypothetical protein [bacterium]